MHFFSLFALHLRIITIIIIIIFNIYIAHFLKKLLNAHYKRYNKYKNKNLFTGSLESKTKTTLFTIGYKKSNLQKNYIKI